MTTMTISFQDPSLKNPLTDIIPAAGANPYNLGAGTAQALGDTVTPQQQQTQSCGIGGIVGGGIGTLGFILGPVGIVTTLGGATLGCAISAAFFPQQGSQAYQQAVNSLGPIGDFVKAVVLILSYIGPIISFTGDAIRFEGALLVVSPQIGVFLLPIQAMTIIWIFWEVATYFRGTGLL